MDWIEVILIFTVLLVIIGWLWPYKLLPRKAKKEINKLLLQHPNADRFIVVNNLLGTLYRGVYADRVSKRERKRLRLEDDAFVYGEIDFLSFMLILDRVQPQPGEVFYDLGSGAGRAVLVAALNYDWSKVMGLELLPALCRLAVMQINKANTLIELSDQRSKQQYLQRVSAIQIANENFLQSDFSDADVVFINATCLPYYTWQSLVERLDHLKPGSRVIVTTKKIQHAHFEVLSQSVEVMSWGMGTVNIYRKIP